MGPFSRPFGTKAIIKTPPPNSRYPSGTKMLGHFAPIIGLMVAILAHTSFDPSVVWFYLVL